MFMVVSPLLAEMRRAVKKIGQMRQEIKSTEVGVILLERGALANRIL
jgi:hypothetical protein